MRILSIGLVWLVFVGLGAGAHAESYRFASFILIVPDGFDGPTRSAPDNKSETLAFSGQHVGGGPSNVIQMTRIEVGPPPTKASELQFFEGATQFLLQMLQGIERRRSSYQQSKITRIQLAGLVGARASWTGSLDGVRTNGVMYCVLVGSQALFFHVFGPGEQPNAQLQSAISAVEHVTK